MKSGSHSNDSTMDYGGHTASTPKPQDKARPIYTPDESEKTRFNSLVTRGIGEYVLKGVLGRGAFGTVYRAYDENLDRDLAIKVLNDPLDDDGIECFQQEAKVIAALGKRPGIVQIHQWGEIDGCPYFVLEYIESSASDLLRRRHKTLPPELALRIAKAVAEALAHAHRQGVLHRDIKPANILLEDNGHVVKLADFGLAHLYQATDSDDRAAMAGSPPFMSPEQIECRKLDGRSDIFSLGVTLYQLLSGKLPFPGKSTTELFINIRQNAYTPLLEAAPNVPPEIAAIVDKATAHDPDDRYASGDAFAAAIEECLRGQAPVAEPAVTATRRSRKKVLATAAAAVAVLAAALAAGPLIRGDSPHSQVLAAAHAQLDQGALQEAEELYSTVLESSPYSAEALYGQGYAALLQGREDDATTYFSAIRDNEELRLEGLAAVTAESDPQNAATAIDAALARGDSAYPKVLLARQELLQREHQAVSERLAELSAGDFRFGWQHAEALRLLGQAYYAMNAYEQAQKVFAELQQASGKSQQALAGAYLRMIEQQVSATKSEDIRQAASRISAMLKESVVDTGSDRWTSRPLTLFVLQPEPPLTPYALDSGLGDLLPSLLGDVLASETTLRVVDRTQLQAVLAEQELSAMLSTKSGQLELGRVLGARLILQPKFLEVGGEQRVYLNAVDVETTENRPVDAVKASELGDEIETVVAELSAEVAEMAAEAYPLQARLYQREQTPYINVGASVGVAEGAIFDVYIDPELPPLPEARIVVGESIGNGSAAVALQGIELAELPAQPDEGYYVKRKAVGK